MESILTSIKKLLGIAEDYEAFDPEILQNINSALMTMMQLGVGPEEGFLVTDKETKWTDLIGERKDLSAITMCVYLKTRLGFDPPQTSFGITAIQDQIKELEWRLNLEVEITDGPNSIPAGPSGNYDNLENKPKIENTELTGNKKLSDIGIKPTTNFEIDKLFK